MPPPARPGECLVRVRLAGICGTDLQLLEGYAGFSGIPGHEFVGTVEAAGAPEDAHLLGARVVAEINVGCGACAFCRRGVKEHCDTRTVVGIRGRDGAFAEYVSLPAANLHVVPEAVSDEQAVFTEPLAAACRILEQVRIDSGTRVAVLGDGRLGLLAAQVLRTAGAEVVLLGRHARKLAIARTLGINAVEGRGDAGDRFDVVVEVTGRAEGLAAAIDLVCPRGTVVLKSTSHGTAAVATWPAVVNEVTLVGSRCGPFAPALALLASGAVQTGPLVSDVARLEDHASAFAAARDGLKVLLAP